MGITRGRMLVVVSGSGRRWRWRLGTTGRRTGFQGCWCDCPCRANGRGARSRRVQCGLADSLHRNGDGGPGQTTLLANFGLRDVQDHFFAIMKGFMALPGFRSYRQDFNLITYREGWGLR